MLDHHGRVAPGVEKADHMDKRVRAPADGALPSNGRPTHTNQNTQLLRDVIGFCSTLFAIVERAFELGQEVRVVGVACRVSRSLTRAMQALGNDSGFELRLSPMRLMQDYVEVRCFVRVAMMGKGVR